MGGKSTTDAIDAKAKESSVPRTKELGLSVFHPDVAKESLQILQALRKRDSAAATAGLDAANKNGTLNAVELNMEKQVDKDGKNNNFNQENILPKLADDGFFSYRQETGSKENPNLAYQFYYNPGAGKNNGGQEICFTDCTASSPSWHPVDLFDGNK